MLESVQVTYDLANPLAQAEQLRQDIVAGRYSSVEIHVDPPQAREATVVYSHVFRWESTDSPEYEIAQKIHLIVNR